MNREVVIALIAAIGAGGLGAAVLDYLRKRKTAPAEGASIIVDAAGDVVIIQRGMIVALQDELKGLHDRYGDLDTRLKACEEVREKVEHELRILEQKAELDQLARDGRIERREQ